MSWGDPQEGKWVQMSLRARRPQSLELGPEPESRGCQGGVGMAVGAGGCLPYNPAWPHSCPGLVPKVPTPASPSVLGPEELALLVL